MCAVLFIEPLNAPFQPLLCPKPPIDNLAIYGKIYSIDKILEILTINPPKRGFPMKKPIILSLIAFVSLNTGVSIRCAENNRFTSAIAHYTQDMVNRHTYEYKSPEHIKTGLLLSLLPSHLSLAVLQTQRSNMVKFLRNNETEALEDVRKYWNFDQQKWSTMMDQTKKDIKCSLNVLQDSHNYNVPHDSSLPSEWITAINNECKRRKFNINNIKLDAKVANDDTFASTHVTYTHYMNPDTKTDISTTITLYPENISRGKRPIIADSHSLQHMATHEMTHVVEGHALYDVNILWDKQIPVHRETNIFRQWIWGIDDLIKDIKTEETNNKLLEQNFKYSPAGQKWKAAKEKIADTLVACTDPQTAKNGYYRTETNGYVDNNNDMKAMHANWQLTQAIEKRRDLYQAFKNTGQKFQSTLRKFMPF